MILEVLHSKRVIRRQSPETLDTLMTQSLEVRNSAAFLCLLAYSLTLVLTRLLAYSFSWQALNFFVVTGFPDVNEASQLSRSA